MSFPWPDPISLVADAIGILGIPTLTVSTIQLYREIKKARTPQSVSHGCLEFIGEDGKCGVNLVPMENIMAIPRVGDEVYLPGETHDSKAYDQGYYEVLKVLFIYSEAPEIEQPCPALPSKISVRVRYLRAKQIK